jgi:hypothetical protein
MNHDIRKLTNLSKKVENCTPAQVLLFVEDAFKKLLQKREFPLA